MIEAIICKK